MISRNSLLPSLTGLENIEHIRLWKCEENPKIEKCLPGGLYESLSWDIWEKTGEWEKCGGEEEETPSEMIELDELVKRESKKEL